MIDNLTSFLLAIKYKYTICAQFTKIMVHDHFQKLDPFLQILQAKNE